MGHVMKRPISVLITTECNLRCAYCLTGSRQYQEHIQTIDMAFVRKGIDDYFAAGPIRELRIYSVGESTTHFKEVRETIEYAQSVAGGKLTTELQSNGMFTPDEAAWFGRNLDTAWISLDGPPEVHDHYRPDRNGRGSAETVIRNIRSLTDKVEVGIRSTTTDINLYRQKELLDFCKSLGVRSVATKPVLNPVGAKREKWSVDLMDYAREFYEAWKYARDIGMYYTCVLIFNFDCRTEYACRACFPTPHLTPDGFVSACDRAFIGTTPLQDLIYGRWVPEKGIIEYDHEKIRRIRQRKPEHMNACRACDIRDYCAGNCMGTGYQETGKLLGTPERYCEAIRWLYDRIKPELGTVTYAGGHP